MFDVNALTTTLVLSLCFGRVLSAATWHTNPFPYNPGFDIEKAAEQAKALPSHSWEYGTASEALLELYNPEYSVFGAAPFPVPKLAKANVPSLAYADSKIVIGTGANALSDGDGAVGDPASLGVSAVLLGKTNDTYATAATAQLDFVVNGAPRAWNGAISHRVSVTELWSDFVYMAPPFIAYYGADTKNNTLIYEAVKQCGEYRQIMQANTTAAYQGIWEHIIGPQSQDVGLWSTGNAWAAAGMTRVLATVMKAPSAYATSWRSSAISNLTTWIKEIVEGAMNAPTDQGLLRNYLNDTSVEHGYGEISGSTLLSAVVYRMAVLRPGSFTSKHVKWADGIRHVLGSNDTAGNPHITADGIATPTVNPLNWYDTVPYTAGSPEGNNFVVLQYAAWRDCIRAGICSSKA